MRDNAFEFFITVTAGLYYLAWDIKDKVVGIFR